VRASTDGYPTDVPRREAAMEHGERDTMNVGEPEEAELAQEELGEDPETRARVPEGAPDEDKAEDEMEPLEGGAETMADLDEEGGQANRPGTERPPV
jgi:hypothetical protein